MGWRGLSFFFDSHGLPLFSADPLDITIFAFWNLLKQACVGRRDLVSYAHMTEKVDFETVERKTLERRGRSRVGAFAHGSNTPPPPPFIG